MIIGSTVFFTLVGMDHWRTLACLWAIIPLLNFVYFTQVPIAPLVEEGRAMPISTLLRSRLFLAAGLTDGMRRSVRTVHEPVGFRFCRERPGRIQVPGRSGRPLFLRPPHGRFPGDLCQHQPPGRTDPLYGMVQYPVRHKLSVGCLCPLADPVPDGLRPVRTVCGDHVAGHLFPGCQGPAHRRNSSLCFACSGRRPGLHQRPHDRGPGLRACRAANSVPVSWPPRFSL